MRERIWAAKNTAHAINQSLVRHLPFRQRTAINSVENFVCLPTHELIQANILWQCHPFNRYNALDNVRCTHLFHTSTMKNSKMHFISILISSFAWTICFTFCSFEIFTLSKSDFFSSSKFLLQFLWKMQWTVADLRSVALTCRCISMVMQRAQTWSKWFDKERDWANHSSWKRVE